MITRTFKLCLNAGTGSAPYINVSQYDEGETWLFELYSETGERYIPSTGAIVGVKSDGHGIINTGTVDNEGRVVITETEQMTAAAGRAIFELSIDGLTHGTANFIVAVERKPTDDAVMSDSDLSLIQQAVDAAEVIEELIEGHDPDEVIADAVDAWLDAHPEATTTVEDGAITSAKLNDSVKNGVFEDMTVGTSLAVMNDEGTTDSLAYKFRQTGGDAVRELDEIVGGTIAWNQLVNTGATSVTVQSGHKYLSKVNNVQTIGASTGTAISINDASADNVFDLTQMFGTAVADAIYAMEQSSQGSGVAYFRSLFPNAYYAYNAGELVSVEGLSAHETVGFNQWDEEWVVSATIGTYGSNFASANLIPVIPNATYYFKTGSYNVAGRGLRIGYYDANKNFISAINRYSNLLTVPDNVHFIKFGLQQTHYGTTYNNDICINISSSLNDTYKPYQKHTYPLDSTLTLRGVPKWNNGLYYDGDIYRHDGSVQRRYGVVDLGSLNWARYESASLAGGGDFGADLTNRKKGAIYDHMICERYAITAYRGATSVPSTEDKIIFTTTNGDATKIYIVDSAYTDAATFKTAMSGVYLVYELETATAETADPYQQYQICDGKGTEEYITETVTPVGHSTFYPVDVVSKVNGLPSDFSTLIAPTEATFKATRNYTAKQFLIINNQLYRVTANIANGGTITPNTNVTAVTIADILTTLI